MGDLTTLQIDNIEVHKWIAVGDIFIDYPLMDYDMYQFNDLYLVEKSKDYEGLYCVFRPRRNGRGAWSRADLICYIRGYEKLLNFINLRARFINLRTDEKVFVDGKFKQKVFIFFPFRKEMDTAVTCMYLSHYDHRYSVTDTIPF